MRRTVLEIGVDGKIAVVIIDRPPEISEFNATGTVTVVFGVIRVVLCGTTTGGKVGIGSADVVFDVLRVILFATQLQVELFQHYYLE